MTTKIIIGDIGTSSCVKLDEEKLTLVSSGGCPTLQILEPLGLNESMDDEEIECCVYDAWIDGYDGDPEENGLTVTVDRDE